jgi:hypothetical protein
VTDRVALSDVSGALKWSNLGFAAMTDPIDSSWSNIAGWDTLKNAAFARRTPTPVIPEIPVNFLKAATPDVPHPAIVLQLSANSCPTRVVNERQLKH